MKCLSYKAPTMWYLIDRHPSIVKMQDGTKYRNPG